MSDHLEVTLLRWSDNSNSGQTVTFLLPEGEVHPFKGLRYGKTGERFAMVLARIEDESTKADHIYGGNDGYTDNSGPKDKTVPKSEGQTCVKMAHALCRDAEFQNWAFSIRLPDEVVQKFIGAHVNEYDWARAVMLHRCGVESRGDFAVNPEACQKLRDLKFEFDHRDTVGR